MKRTFRKSLFLLLTVAVSLIFSNIPFLSMAESAQPAANASSAAPSTPDPGAVPPDQDPQANAFRISPRSGNQHLDLSLDWQFGCRDSSVKNCSQLGEITDWYVMKRPMSVQRALFRAGVVGDPFKGMNSKDLEWAEQKIWYFRKSFELPEGFKKSGNSYVFLSFDGLDYYSRVWVNGTHLDRHEGMFGGPDFEISGLLKSDAPNEIVVAVGSANYGNPDFAPRSSGKFIKPWSTTGGSGVEPFFTLGFWRGARLDCVPKTHLERPYLTTKLATPEKAILHFETEVLANTHSLKLQLHRWTNHQLYDFSGGNTVRNSVGECVVRISLTSPKGANFVKDCPISMLEGQNWLKADLELEHPELWSINGIGADPETNAELKGSQPLYQARIQLLRDGKELDRIEFPFGIRTIEWVPSAGPKVFDRWTDWQVMINGRKIFLKGCNWMPIDVMLDLPPEKYDWYVRLARDAGIQIFRIWGPGLQESEGFYDACDRCGILVWQDFPIGNADVGGWPLPVWESQLLGTIWRLRNRASLAVWCGGNEFNPYCLGNSAVVGTLERNLALFDPSRKFLRTSPDCGSYHCYPDMDPTWYGKRFSQFPYLAESGIHSVTSSRTLRDYVNPDEFRHVSKMYLEEYRTLAPESVHHFVEYAAFRVPRMLTRASHFVAMTPEMTLDDMALGTQLGASEFYQVMADCVQSNYPVTTGMMPWVFARSWPVTSAIQLVDGTGQPVMPYYYLKNAYRPFHPLVCVDRLLWKAGESFRLTAKVLNLGTLPGCQGELRIRVLNDRFESLLDVRKTVSVPDGPAVAEVPMDAWQIPADYRNRFFFVIADFTDENAHSTRTVYWPRTIPQMEDPAFYEAFTTNPKNWPAMPEEGPRMTEVLRGGPQAKLEWESVSCETERNAEYRLTTHSLRVRNISDVPSLVTYVELDAPGTTFVASENYFFLDAREERTVTVRVRESAVQPQTEQKIRFGSLNAR